MRSWELYITWFIAEQHCTGSATKRTNDMNDSSCRTDRRELNLNIELWNPPLAGKRVSRFLWCHCVARPSHLCRTCPRAPLLTRHRAVLSCCFQRINNERNNKKCAHVIEQTWWKETEHLNMRWGRKYIMRQSRELFRGFRVSAPLTDH